MKNVALVALAALVVGCGSTMTLEEMEAARELAATSEERQELDERIDRFYENWDAANLYFENRELCLRTSGYQFYCDNVQAYKGELDKLTPEARVRVWRREYQACQCLTDSQAQSLFNSIKRQMGQF